MTIEDGSEEVAANEDADIGDAVGQGLRVVFVGVEELEDAADHEWTGELEEVGEDGDDAGADEVPADVFAEGSQKSVLFDVGEGIVDSVEDLVVVGGLLDVSEVGEIVHIKMLLIASADDLVGPEEEHLGDEARVFLEAGLVGELLVDLELLLGLLLLHKNKTIINLKYILNIPKTTPPLIGENLILNRKY